MRFAVAPLALSLTCAACAKARPTHASGAPEPSPAVTITTPEPTAVASEPPPPVAPTVDAGVDWDAEVAWLRERDPKLAGLRRGSPVDALLDWVEPDAEIDIWVTAGPHRCAPGRASRTADGDRLRFSMIESDTRVGGKRVRSWIDGYAGQLLSYGSSGHKERQRADGTWESSGGWGRSGGPVAGALNDVGAERASYDARPIYIAFTCPWVALACEDGGSRGCRDCKAFQAQVFVITNLHGGFGMTSGPKPKSTCSQACPAEDTSAFDRATRLKEITYELSLPPEKPAATGLYRSLAACKAAR
ncbi:MAG: hypothetical protein R3B13_00850 [Polyangiaceae bacterium]